MGDVAGEKRLVERRDILPAYATPHPHLPPSAETHPSFPGLTNAHPPPQNTPPRQLLGNRLRRRCGLPSVFGDDAAAVAAAVAAAHAHGAAAPPAGGGRAAQFNPLRRAALRPGGPIATRFFAPHPTVLQVGSTVFVHGGVLPAHVEYGLERINAETQRWLLGDAGGDSSGGAAKGSGSSSGAGGDGSSPRSSWLFGGRAGAAAGGGGGAAPPQQPPPQPPPAPGFLRGASAIVWAREYSARDEARCDCDKLEAVLGAMAGAKRMVVSGGRAGWGWRLRGFGGQAMGQRRREQSAR
jgi:hypothetical protein